MILTAQDIHEAYNQVRVEEYRRRTIALDLIEWQDVSEENRKLYVRLAELLNEKIQQNANSN